MIYSPAVATEPTLPPAVDAGDDVAMVQAVEARADDVAVAMRELAQLLVADETVETTLHRVADLATRVIEGCDAAGVTLVQGDRYLTAAHTDERTLAVDRGQYALGHGPCLEAIRQREVLRFDVDEAEERWPKFVADSRANDVRSFLAAPLLLNGEAIGSLNLYSAKPSGFVALDDLLVALFTGQAAVAVSNAKVYTDAVALTRQLQAALESRAVIDQAKGILMARTGVDADAAFDELRRQSQTRNVKLRAVAQEIVDSTARPTET